MALKKVDETYDPITALIYSRLLSAEHSTLAFSKLLPDKDRSIQKIDALKKVLESRQDLFCIHEVSSDGDRSESYVEAKFSIRICASYSPSSSGVRPSSTQNAGEVPECSDLQCNKLHVCYHYLKSKCRFAEKCKNSHHLLHNEHNVSVLAHHGLSELGEDQLLRLLKKVDLTEGNEPTVSPVESNKPLEICSFYNRKFGCKNGEMCPFLHVCVHHAARKGCKFGKECKRGHNMNSEHCRKVLGRAGVSEIDAYIHLIKLEREKETK